jgi:GTP-binding protein Era
MVNNGILLYFDQLIGYLDDRSKGNINLSALNLTSVIGAKFNITDSFQLGLEGFYNQINILDPNVSYNPISYTYRNVNQSTFGGMLSIAYAYGAKNLQNNILENIKQFGFKKSFFTRKWKYQDIVLESIPNTTNMKFKLNGEYILLNYYGNFEGFKKDLERKIVSNAKTANLDADLVCVMFDGRKEKIDEITLSLLEKHKRLDKKVIFVINKIDSYSQDRLIAQLSNLFNPSLMDEIVPLSALKNVGVEELKDLIFSCAKEGEWYYGEDDITDRDNYFITAEVLREKVFENLNQELPYSIDVVTDKITQEGDVFKIMQTIYVEKQGQKNIVIGSKGSMISKIIKQSIPKLQEVMQGKVVLNVFVKISKDWIEKWSGK